MQKTTDKILNEQVDFLTNADLYALQAKKLYAASKK